MLSLVSVAFASGCAPQLKASEEQCTDCTEQSLNAPVGDEEDVNLNGDTKSSEQTYSPGSRSSLDHLDPKKLVPAKLLSQAKVYWLANQERFTNKNFMAIFAISQKSSAKRFFLIDLESGAVSAHNVSHGVGSDTNNDGFAERFSNTPDSKMSSLGFYATGKTYQGKHGTSLYLDGLSSTNSNARSRYIVIHAADYVSDQNSVAGRSWGCPALDPKVALSIINKMKLGSMLYIAQ